MWWWLAVLLVEAIHHDEEETTSGLEPLFTVQGDCLDSCASSLIFNAAELIDCINSLKYNCSAVIRNRIAVTNADMCTKENEQLSVVFDVSLPVVEGMEFSISSVLLEFSSPVNKDAFDMAVFTGEGKGSDCTVVAPRPCYTINRFIGQGQFLRIIDLPINGTQTTLLLTLSQFPSGIKVDTVHIHYASNQSKQTLPKTATTITLAIAIALVYHH